MEIGVFVPINNNGWLISEAAMLANIAVRWLAVRPSLR